VHARARAHIRWLIVEKHNFFVDWRFRMENFRVAIVGLDKMGLLYANILSMMPNFELVTLCGKSWQF
jgi:hypothetical protein